jgi:hypothetical protein
VWSKGSESYAGGSVAVSRVSHVGQFKGDDPDEKRYPGPPGGGLYMSSTISPRKTFVEKNPKVSRERLIKRRRFGCKEK